ncbi:MAG: amino acid adenylation domain-containing protein [Cytophagales bacterium]|nr:amino acid adenylation domain-containing protein [Cytophagales bacterium]
MASHLIEAIQDAIHLKKGITFINADQNDDYLTYRELYENAVSALAYLQRQGLKQKDELVLQIEDNQQFLIVFWACILGGIIPVPLSVAKNQDQFRKLEKVWGKLNNPGFIGTKAHLDKVIAFVSQQEGDRLALDISKAFLDSANLQSHDHEGQIADVTAADIAFIQFSSGSTGSPKGVVLTHENLITNVAAIASAANYTNDDTMLSWMPLTHDMGMIGFHLNPLFIGMDQYLMPTNLFLRRPEMWLLKASQNAVTILCSPNFGYSYYLKHFDEAKNFSLDLSQVRIIYNGAEPISKEICTEFSEKLNSYGLKEEAICPVYGMAEATLAVTMSGIDDRVSSTDLEYGNTGYAAIGYSQSIINVGRPIDHCQLRITNEEDQVVTDGIVGQIEIKGRSVTGGYYNDEERTREILNEEHWLKTGDLGFVQDGQLYVTGRIKDIIFINGQNYYPHDLEQMSTEVEGIELNQIVIGSAFDEATDSSEILAFVLHRGELKDFISKSQGIKTILNQQTGVVLDRVLRVRNIPKTTSGKLQRFKLIESYREGAFADHIHEVNELIKTENDQRHFGLENETERQVLKIWHQVIKNDHIGVADHFLEVGGNSLRAAEISMLILKHLGVSIALTSFFENPTVRQLALQIQNKEGAEHDIIPKANPAHRYPLSSTQKGIYYLCEIDPSSTAYNIPIAFEIKGEFDPKSFEKRVAKLIAKHDALRMSFSSGDDPYFTIQEQANVEVSYAHCLEKDLDEHLRGLVRPFDLGQAALFRIEIVNSENRKLLFLDFHHLISDGTSVESFVIELFSIDENELLVQDHIGYKDYAAWVLHAQPNNRNASGQYWTKLLSEELPKLELPIDHPRPARFNHVGEKVPFELNLNASEALRQIARENGYTLGTTMFAIYRILLYKLSYQQEAIIGVATSGRQLPELMGVQGMFVNNLPVRCKVDPNLAFDTWLEEVHGLWKEVLEHQDHAFEKIAERVEEQRDLSRNAVFDTMFVFQNFQRQIDLGQLQVEHYFFDPKAAKYDLTLEVYDDQQAIRYFFEYATTLFERSTIERIGKYYSDLVEQVLANPSSSIADLVLVSEESYEQSVQQFNDTNAEFPGDKKITDLFADQVLKTPDHVAISQGGSLSTYKELSNQVDKTVTLFQKEGLKPGDVVALKLPRSPELIISILALLKTGCAYVPMDEHMPEERLLQIIDDCQCDFMLFSSKDGTQHAKENSQLIIGSEVFYWSQPTWGRGLRKPEDLAYIIYTSGTTGKPKGVMIGHQSLVNYCDWAASFYASNKPCSFPLFTSISFDLTVTSIFVPLITGGKIIIYDQEDILATMQMILTDEEVNTIKLTPSHLKVLNELGESANANSHLQTFIIGGENLSHDLALRTSDLFDHKVQIYNEYGPSEATVGCMIYEFDGAETTPSVPIGKPVQNTKIHIFDDCLKPVPQGVVGQIYIEGEGLSLGYCLNQELTEQRFLNHPFYEGVRIYDSGDKGRLLPNGNIEFLGRADDQVKINGYRIELEEVAHHLSLHDQVKESIVLAVGAEGDQYLVAYFTPESHVSSVELRDHLMRVLPLYMVPAHYVEQDYFPLTANGKLDKGKLPLPNLVSDRDFIAPETYEEQLLSEIWSEILQKDQIDITSNFFWLGGDSIKAVQIVSRLLDRGYQTMAKDLLSNPTIRELSLLITPVARKVSQSPVSGVVPLTGIQQRFFHAKLTDKHHHNQSVMLHFSEDVATTQVNEMLVALKYHHDALRSRFQVQNEGVLQEVLEPDEEMTLIEWDFRGVTNLNQQLMKAGEELQSSLDLSMGPLVVAGLFKTDEGNFLLIVIHHLVVDGVSWRVILDDIDSIYQQLKTDQPIKLPEKTDAFKTWSERLSEYQKTASFGDVKTFWDSLLKATHTPVPRKKQVPERKISKITRKKISLNQRYTEMLRTDVHRAYNTEISDMLLASFAAAAYECFDIQQLRLDLEGHGREEILENLDLSRTVGWFTSIYPIILNYQAEKGISENLIGVKETMRAIPNRGLDYLLVENQYQNTEGLDLSQSRICFNYLGQFDNITYQSFQLSDAPMGNMRSPNQEQRYDWDIIGLISGGSLELELSYSNMEYGDNVIDEFMEQFRQQLIEIIDHCSGHGQIDLTPSDLSYKGLSRVTLDDLKEKYAMQDAYQLAPMQKTLHAHATIHPDSEDYFEQLSFRWQGDLEITFVQQVLETLADRHPVLRTVFHDQDVGETLQIVLNQREIDFEYQDIRGEVTQLHVDDLIDQYRKSDRTKLFNLSQEGLMRVRLYQLGAQDYFFIWSYHHIIMDGWSTGILLNEFRSLYESLHLATSPSLPFAKPYSTYINWLQRMDFTASISFWKDHLLGYERPASFSALPETSQPVVKAYRSQSLAIDQSGLQALSSICADLGVTLSTVFQTLWGVLLSRYNDTNDVVFGSVSSGRPPELQGVEQMLGLFINTLPVRVKYEVSCTVKELLKQQQELTLACQPYSFLGLSEIQSAHELGKNLFDHLVVIENYPVDKFFKDKSLGKSKDFEIDKIEMVEQTNYDLSVTVFPGEQLNIVLEYNTNLYNDPFVETLKHQLGSLLNTLPTILDEQVDTLEVLSKDERHHLLHVFNQTDVGYPQDTCIIDLFESQVIQHPDHTAINYHGEQLTYRELNNKANQLGQFLREQGVSKNQLVGLIIDDSLDMIISIMGILKSGAAYLPIDPNYPLSRIQYMLDNSNTRFVLMGQELFKEFRKEDDGRLYWSVAGEEISAFSDENLTGVNDPEDLAYVIYTSGTTGNPKGAKISHRNVVRLFFNDNNLFDFSASDTWTKFHSFSFDFSVWEIFGALLNGGKLILVSKEEARDPGLFLNMLQEHQVTILNQTPSAFQNLLSVVNDSSELQLNLRKVIFGGEKLIPASIKSWNDRFPEVQLINMYGITETTVHVTYKEVTSSMLAEDMSNVGRPIPTTQVYVFDRKGRLVPIGVTGEMYVGGEGVCLGYLNNKDLTSQKFVENPFNRKEKLYRTGDLAYWLPEGELVYVSRMDDQVQIRGYRVELGEIEQKISTHPNIRDAMVLYNADGPGDLVAYYLSEKEISDDQIRVFLEGQLPIYMIPQYFIQLTEFPLTSNGKVDKGKLPAPTFKSNPLAISPRNELEFRLVEIWQDLLNVDQVGIRDSFFELGGHSLKVTQLVKEIYKAFNVQIPHKEIFQRSTIEDLSVMIEAMKSFEDTTFGADDPEIEEITI